jgi:hypothetical protein
LRALWRAGAQLGAEEVDEGIGRFKIGGDVELGEVQQQESTGLQAGGDSQDKV